MAHINGNIHSLEIQALKLSKEELETISHDFRAPLNIIIGFTELLLEEVPGKINDEQRRSLGDILNSAQRLLSLVNDTFKQSSPGSGEILNR
jgi:signal transduction histidine kinase